MHKHKRVLFASNSLGVFVMKTQSSLACIKSTVQTKSLQRERLASSDSGRRAGMAGLGAAALTQRHASTTLWSLVAHASANTKHDFPVGGFASEFTLPTFNNFSFAHNCALDFTTRELVFGHNSIPWSPLATTSNKSCSCKPTGACQLYQDTQCVECLLSRHNRNHITNICMGVRLERPYIAL